MSCGISSFGDPEAQREHVKCDWHRYNVKMRVLGRPTVGEDEFDALVEDDDVASISGSDDEYDDEYDGSWSREDGALAPYCIFQARADDSAEPQWLGFWKCLAVPDARGRQTPTTNAAYEAVCLAAEKAERWAVLMLQGGHFAAAVYEVSLPSDRVLQVDTKTHGELTDLCMREVQHKSFHRYVVRAKAGGKQSDKDATGKFAVRVGNTRAQVVECPTSPLLAPSTVKLLAIFPVYTAPIARLTHARAGPRRCSFRRVPARGCGVTTKPSSSRRSSRCWRNGKASSTDALWYSSRVQGRTGSYCSTRIRRWTRLTPV